MQRISVFSSIGGMVVFSLVRVIRGRRRNDRFSEPFTRHASGFYFHLFLSRQAVFPQLDLGRCQKRAKLPAVEASMQSVLPKPPDRCSLTWRLLPGVHEVCAPV